MEFKKKINKHKYHVIGGYRNYCTDLDTVIKEYEATEGLGIQVHTGYLSTCKNFHNHTYTISCSSYEVHIIHFPTFGRKR